MKILGMMSGTSGDGIDGVLVEFFENSEYKLIWHKSMDFSPEEFQRILHLMKGCSSVDVTLGNTYIAELYVRAFESFFEKDDEKPDYIAAHGQTIWHQPNAIAWDGISLRGTLQLLDAPLLAYKTGVPVINNFRAADMAAGGQGAPLVPFADLELFGNLFPEDCIVLNIGGMANITAIKKINGKPQVLCAFDTGPGNVLMDTYIQQKGMGQYDKDGRIAYAGKPIDSILDEIMQDPYFSAPYPKSTGREYFNSNILMRYKGDYKPADFVATLLEVTAKSIAKGIGLLDKSGLRFPLKLIAAGGGAKNPVLMEHLQRVLDGYCEVHISDEFGVPVMAREAMAFAVLGKAFVERKPANIISATGAREAVILGQFSPIL